jgi:choline dehydrogenase-like flavoprotein
MDALTNATTEYRSKVVFLCASTLNSTWLLMRSATDVWPGGSSAAAPASSGHNLMDHHFRCGASGISDEPKDKTVYGRRPNGFLHSPFQESLRRQARVPARFRVSGLGQPARLAARDRRARSWRPTQGRGRRRRDPGRSGGGAFGEMLPNHANRITFDPVKKDKWGLPVLAIDCETVRTSA